MRCPAAGGRLFSAYLLVILDDREEKWWSGGSLD